jgi:hypothetical protein
MRAPRVFLSYAGAAEDWVHTFCQWFRVRDAMLVDYKDTASFGSIADWVFENEAAGLVAFVSGTYISSKYSQQLELDLALERCAAGRLVLVPVIMDANARVWWKERTQSFRQRFGLSDIDSYAYADFVHSSGVRPVDIIGDKGIPIPGVVRRIQDLAEMLSEELRRDPPIPPLRRPEIVVLGHPTATQPSLDPQADAGREAVTMASKVFVSYRRDDSAGHAGRVTDRLAREFGRDLLFMDVDAIPLGTNFLKVLHEEVGKCGVLLAVIGPNYNWLDARDDDGSRRLDDPSDFVRIEIATALQRNIPVIPILLDSASIPKANQLPKDLKELALRNGLNVRHASFHADLDRLIRRLKELLGSAGALPAHDEDDPGHNDGAGEAVVTGTPPRRAL